MFSVLTPLSIGAAASALSSVADAIPTPGDFAAALQRAGGPGQANAPADLADKQPPENAVPGIAPIGSRSELRRLIHDIEKSLAKLLARREVDMSKAIRLKLDGAGRVKANADHPDAAAIDELLAGDENLSAALTQALKSINSATSPELLGGMSAGGASVGEPTLTMFDGALTPSLG
jgi:hypothetical protein